MLERGKAKLFHAAWLVGNPGMGPHDHVYVQFVKARHGPHCQVSTQTGVREAGGEEGAKGLGQTGMGRRSREVLRTKCTMAQKNTGRS